MDGPTIVGCVQAAILSVTAVIVWWYTNETQRLRETAQQQIEVQQRPFIIVTPRPHHGSLVGLTVRNIGNSATI